MKSAKEAYYYSDNQHFCEGSDRKVEFKISVPGPNTEDLMMATKDIFVKVKEAIFGKIFNERGEYCPPGPADIEVEITTLHGDKEIKFKILIHPFPHFMANETSLNRFTRLMIHLPDEELPRTRQASLLWTFHRCPETNFPALITHDGFYNVDDLFEEGTTLTSGGFRSLIEIKHMFYSNLANHSDLEKDLEARFGYIPNTLRIFHLATAKPE